MIKRGYSRDNRSVCGLAIAPIVTVEGFPTKVTGSPARP